MNEVSATSGMKIDIIPYLKSKDIIKSLPILGQFKDFVNYQTSTENIIPKNLVVGYVIILYSEDSFLNKQPMAQLDQRQIMAAEAVGIKSRKGTFEDVVVNDLFDLNNPTILKMAFEYLLFQHNSDWQVLVATETLRLRYLKAMMSPTNSTKDLESKSKFNVIVKGYNDDIAILMKDIFADHKKLQEEGKKKLWGDTIETII